MAMEYYSFEKVLKELMMEEDELKRLVSEGEIRAFRDEDKMKFKRTDIDGLRKGRMTEPTIILPSNMDHSGSDDEVLLVEEDTSETLLDIDDIGGGSSSTSVPTVDFGSSSDDSAAETLTEELVFDDSSSGTYIADSSGTMTESLESQDTFIDEGDTGMTTEPLELLESSDEVASVPQRRAAPAQGGSPRAIPQRQAMAAPKQSHPIMNVVLIFTALISLYSGFIVFSMIEGNDNDYTAGVTDFVVQYAPPGFATKNPTSPQPKEVKEHLDWRRKMRQTQKR